MAGELTAKSSEGRVAATPARAALVEGVVAACRQFLIERAAAELAPFLSCWPRTEARRPVVPMTLAAVRWMSTVPPDGEAAGVDLLHSIRLAAPHMAWRQSYSEREIGAGFLDRYAWTELVGLHGPLPSDRLACGILLLGPATHYPAHFHEAEEVYVPLSGYAEWQRGDGEWRERAPGSVILHASHEPHAMRTSDDPLIAVYVWRSANLDQASRLDPSHSAPAATGSAKSDPASRHDNAADFGRRK